MDGVPRLNLPPEADEFSTGMNSVRSAGGPRRTSTVLEGSGNKVLSARGSDPATKQATSKREFEARRKAAETKLRHEKLEDLRANDNRRIQERARKQVQDRERNFEAQLQAVNEGDQQRVEAAALIRTFERDQLAKRTALYNKWDDQVYQRIEFQLAKYMSDHPPELPEENWRDMLLKTDCPVKRPLYDHMKEDEFQREAQSVINAPALQDGEDFDRLRNYVAQRELFDEAVKTREKSRPVLPVPLWAQQYHFASRDGYFQRSCERQQQGLGFHSARRMGTDAHLPFEGDGVECAGKTKTRFEKNSIGILTGIVAKQGQAALYKREDGCSCGAPLQDHYNYERTIEAADREFPIGKRIFQELRAVRGG